MKKLIDPQIIQDWMRREIGDEDKVSESFKLEL